MDTKYCCSAIFLSNSSSAAFITCWTYSLADRYWTILSQKTNPLEAEELLLGNTTVKAEIIPTIRKIEPRMTDKWPMDREDSKSDAISTPAEWKNSTAARSSKPSR